VLQLRRHVVTVAPSSRIARTLTAMLAASIVTAAIAVVAPPSFAQQSPAAASTQNSAASSSQPATTAPPSGFQSQGIKATITSISLQDKRIILQFLVQNTRQTGVYLAVVGGFGGSAGTIMATNGAVYTMNGGNTITGIPSCYGGYVVGTDQNVAECLKTSNENDMSMVEAGQTAVLGIIYDRKSQNSADPSDTINFVLKFIVRSAPAQGGTLAAAAAAGKAGPPSVVAITFPLVPLTSQ
jgi:hypothetical protein